jgi:DNA repair exonuclease SbcCD nuclease subunit
MNLFKRAAVFTDLHIGLKSNSTVHNEDCWNFVQWFTATALAENCDTVIMTGDWHNHRASINVLSLNYSLKCLEHLNDNFSQVFIIPGNHDLFYREKRDINSIEWAKHLPNVHVVNDFLTEGDVTFCPWLVNDEFRHLKTLSSKYIFGHFELPNFFMNSMIVMPQHGDFDSSYLANSGHVFSGHFHQRQSKNNITYMGNAFPHNYSDAGDDARGMMILTWGQMPVFKTWPKQPRYRVYNLSSVLDDPDTLLAENMHVRVNLDIPISYEESLFIKDQLAPKYMLREMSLIPTRTDLSKDDTNYNDMKFESVDSIIQTQIQQLQAGDAYDPQLLLSIYQTL